MLQKKSSSIKQQGIQSVHKRRTKRTCRDDFTKKLDGIIEDEKKKTKDLDAVLAVIRGVEAASTLPSPAANPLDEKNQVLAEENRILRETMKAMKQAATSTSESANTSSDESAALKEELKVLSEQNQALSEEVEKSREYPGFLIVLFLIDLRRLRPQLRRRSPTTKNMWLHYRVRSSNHVPAVEKFLM